MAECPEDRQDEKEEIDIVTRTSTIVQETVVKEKHGARYDTFFYQQNAQFFLSRPRAQPMGGFVGYVSRIIGGSFTNEPENMLSVSEVEETDRPSMAGSSSQCSLSQETQRVSKTSSLHVCYHGNHMKPVQLSYHVIKHRGLVYSNVFPTFPVGYMKTIFLSIHSVLVVCGLACL